MDNTVTLFMSHEDVEDFRKAMKIVKDNYSTFETLERQLDGFVSIAIVSDNAMVFYKIGEAYGTIREFKSKKS